MRSDTSASVRPSCASNQCVAWDATSGCGFSSTFHPLTSRNAFHILLQKLRPCSHSLSSYIISFPAGAASIRPMRTPSAPYWAIKSSGSGELPSCFDILRPMLSRTMPVKYTLLNGFFPIYSYPAIIMRATQKNMMSGPVTRSDVG